LTIDGAPLAAPALRRLRARTVWIDPAVQIWNRSLADNLAFGARAAPGREALARAVAEAELDDVVARLPDGLATPLGEGGGLVSGGGGRRARFARELLRVERPRLARLDEPFRGLDRDARRRLLARARARWADATLLVVTHDVSET